MDANWINDVVQKYQVSQAAKGAAFSASAPAAQSSAPPNAFDQALQQYAVLKNLGLQGSVNLRPGNNLLEFWQPGESGDATAPRPSALALDKPGVEIYNEQVKPSDVLADVTSHYLVKQDPRVAAYYQQFRDSLSADQNDRLKDQYAWAVKNEGERRSYDKWLETSGMPAYFRGYAFKQWPESFNQKAYTPAQRRMFDQMVQYLEKGQ